MSPHKHTTQDLFGLQIGIIKRFSDQFNSLVDIGQGVPFQLRPSVFTLKMIDLTVIKSIEIRNRQIRDFTERQFYFRFFRSLDNSLIHRLVVKQVFGDIFLYLLQNPFDDLDIKVTATQKSVAHCRDHTMDTGLDFNNGNIEGPTTQIIHGIQTLFFDSVPICDQGGRRFIDYSGNVKPGDFTGYLGGLSLGIIKKGRNRHHGLTDLFSQVIFSRLF